MNKVEIVGHGTPSDPQKSMELAPDMTFAASEALPVSISLKYRGRNFKQSIHTTTRYLNMCLIRVVN